MGKMNYLSLIESMPAAELVNVEMADGSLVECKRVPLASIQKMEPVFVGVSNNLINLADKGLDFVARCGKSKLYTAVGDATNYMKKADGTILSAAIGKKGKIISQPGFVESNVAQEGIQAATNAAKVLPWIGLAISIVEVGANIVLSQKQIRAEQIAYFNNCIENLEDQMANLWKALETYPYSLGDEQYRGAQLRIILDANNAARNKFDRLIETVKVSKKVDPNLVYTLKEAIDVFSFSHLLQVIYKKDECIDFLKIASNEIKERNLSYENVHNRCLQEQMLRIQKEDKVLSKLAYKKNANTLDIVEKIGMAIATGGLSTAASGVLTANQKKKLNKDKVLLEKLRSGCISDNKYLNCIENVGKAILENKLVMTDDTYLYYQNK